VQRGPAVGSPPQAPPSGRVSVIAVAEIRSGHANGALSGRDRSYFFSERGYVPRARAAQRWRSRSRFANDASRATNRGPRLGCRWDLEPQIPTLWAKARTRGSTGTTAAPRERVSQIDRPEQLQTDYALL
jgi:hypothetical protein